MRKSAAQAFYLAVFALFGGDCQAQRISCPSSATASNPDVCAVNPQSQVSDACASYADLDRLNADLQPYVRNLANNTDFFSYYRLNLYHKTCPFWNDESGMCGNIACAVTTLENEDDVPAIWRAEELSKLQGPKAHHPGRQEQRERRQKPLQGELGADVGESCVVEYDDECDERDYCVPEDESASAKGDYLSLAENPERFTGYAGEGAHQVWEAIYRENCFSRPTASAGSVAGQSGTPPKQQQAQAVQDFKQVLRAHDRQQAVLATSDGAVDASFDLEDEQCVEKRVFHRVISGMHASISTHLCYDYLNQTTGQWGPNLQCYRERLHEYPERISNLYFNYALVLRAVGKLRDYVQTYTFCTGDPQQDGRTREMIRTLANKVSNSPQQVFDESVMFQDQSASGIELKEDFRQRFRNVSRIMDCVGCDKCRLWGKLQTAGYGAALKVLFEFGDAEHPGSSTIGQPLLRRTELVALINTLDKISTALKALGEFRAMVAAEDALRFQETDDFEDFDNTKPTIERPVPTLADEFWAELDLVWRAYKHVLRTWIELPKTLGGIAITEFSRLTEYWLGVPVKPRSWEIRIPSRDEL